VKLVKLVKNVRELILSQYTATFYVPRAENKHLINALRYLYYSDY